MLNVRLDLGVAGWAAWPQRGDEISQPRRTNRCPLVDFFDAHRAKTRHGSDGVTQRPRRLGHLWASFEGEANMDLTRSEPYQAQQAEVRDVIRQHGDKLPKRGGGRKRTGPADARLAEAPGRAWLRRTHDPERVRRLWRPTRRDGGVLASLYISTTDPSICGRIRIGRARYGNRFAASATSSTPIPGASGIRINPPS